MTQIPRTPVDALTARRLGLAPGWTRATLEAEQMDAVRRTVRHALRQSPWYARHLGDIDPEKLRTPADMARLPMMTAQDVAAHGGSMLCVSQSAVARIITLQTSGSTGAPKRIQFSREDLDATVDFFLQGMFSLIASADTVLAVLPFAQPDSTGELLIRALSGGGVRCLGCWPPEPWPQLAARIRDEGITCVVGLPQHLLALAYELPFGLVRSMLLCSDYAPPSLRTRIEMLCGCATFLHYGTTETGLGGGVECTAHDGCHLRESDLLLEIISPVTGEPVAAGQAGEVVVTTLGRQAMPLLRYRTGDVARLVTAPCVCGGLTARLSDIQGRRISCLLPGGAELTSQILDDALFALDGLVDYRAILESTARGERLGIDFLARDNGGHLEARMVQALERVPAVAVAVAHGLRVGPLRHVDAFAPSHTVKRTIADVRRRR